MNDYANFINQINIIALRFLYKIINTLLPEQNIKFYPRGASAQIYPTTVLPSLHVADLSQ